MAPHSFLTNAQRRSLCEYKIKYPSISQIQLVKYMSEEHNVTITQATVSKTLKKSSRIMQDSELDLNLKRNISINYPDVDKALVEWVLMYQERFNIIGYLIETKAAECRKLCYPNTNSIKEDASGSSNGWLQSFQKRNSIKGYRRHGESGSVNQLLIQNALPHIRDVIDEYNPEDVYNMDETGLFFRLQPDRSLATYAIQGQKKDKERISIVICANESGTDRIPLTIIGHYKNPHCFKDHGNNMERYGIKWRVYTKAWMTTTIFQERLKAFDLKMAGRRVLLIFDNAPSHKLRGIQLNNTIIHFLPPNTTSVIQPCNAGIIRTFKAHYRKA